MEKSLDAAPGNVVEDQLPHRWPNIFGSMISRFDHITIGIAADRLEDILAGFRRAGFDEHDRRVFHADGRVSAFLLVSGGYLEFTATAGTSASISGGGNSLSISAVTRDITSTRRKLSAGNISIPEIEVSGPAGESAPAWAILSLPEQTTPGMKVAVIEYLRGAGRQIALRQGRNAIFGIGGFTMESEFASAVAEKWYATLGSALQDGSKTGNRIEIGAQFLRWRQVAAARPSGTELLIAMYSLSMETSRMLMLGAGFVAGQPSDDGFVAQFPLLPHISFAVSQVSSIAAFSAFLLNGSAPGSELS